MDSCSDSVRLLWRNPQLLKAALAAGIQACAGAVIYAMVVGPLKTEVWEEHQSERQSEMAMATSVFSALSSYYFGTFSDQVDRRVAVMLFGFFSFLPAWSLLVFGFGSTGLWVFMSLQVLAGLGASSNVMLVLATDVTEDYDRELAFGSFFAVSTLVSLLGQGIPEMLIMNLQVVPNNPAVVLWTHVGMSTAFFAIVATIRPGVQNTVEPEPCLPISQSPTMASTGVGVSATVSEAVADVERKDAQEDAAEQSHRCCASSAAACAWLLPFNILLENRMLGIVCLITVVLEFAQDLTFDIGGQFFMSSLDLIEHGTLREQQMVTVLSSVPTQLVAIPAFALVGWLAKRYSPLELLRFMIPFAAVMIMAGAVMKWYPQMWCIPVVCITENLAGLTSVPLQLLIAELAPKGRLGEAMGVIGMTKQIVAFSGNAVVALVNPVLMQSGLENPLWIYYPVCACLKVLAFPGIYLLSTDAMVLHRREQARRKTVIRAKEETLRTSRAQTLPGFGSPQRMAQAC
eukprot:gb/GFBE01043565.1/.p1 GENE.gb/GFBE01043565.1/~~gb/GFBE01043565.1/.p1  ORF type:complete len:516 (+),score=107.69 gb/GFBE01043565.1/:1-1548(+)